LPINTFKNGYETTFRARFAFKLPTPTQLPALEVVNSCLIFYICQLVLLFVTEIIDIVGKAEQCDSRTSPDSSVISGCRRKKVGMRRNKSLIDN
jgi:hypothetical protein